MHPIIRFLNEQGWTQRQLAAAADLSPQHISNIAKRTHACGRKAAMKIERATGGKVTADELIRIEPILRRKKASRRKPARKADPSPPRARSIAASGA